MGFLLLCVSGMYFIIAFVLHAQTFSHFLFVKFGQDHGKQKCHWHTVYNFFFLLHFFIFTNYLNEGSMNYVVLLMLE